MVMKSDGSDSVTVVMNNRSSPSKRKKVCKSTQSRISSTPSRTAHCSSRRMKITFCESPEAIKLRLPGLSSSSSRRATAHEELPSPPSLFRSPEKIWMLLKCSPPSKESKISSRACGADDKENYQHHNCCRFNMMGPLHCNSSSCEGGGWCYSPDGTTDHVFRSNNSNAFNNKSGLTQDMLQQHERMIHKTPDRVPKFEGDQLAQTVILQSKTNLQLAKEGKEKAQQELERVLVAGMLPTTSSSTGPEMTDDIKTWIELERQKALAAKWQRKKNEQWERVRAEQLRLGELERQRKLLTLSPGKNRKSSAIDATPATPKTAHLKARKLIYI